MGFDIEPRVRKTRVLSNSYYTLRNRQVVVFDSSGIIEHEHLALEAFLRDMAFPNREWPVVLVPHSVLKEIDGYLSHVTHNSAGAQNIEWTKRSHRLLYVNIAEQVQFDPTLRQEVTSVLPRLAMLTSTSILRSCLDQDEDLILRQLCEAVNLVEPVISSHRPDITETYNDVSEAYRMVSSWGDLPKGFGWINADTKLISQKRALRHILSLRSILQGRYQDLFLEGMERVDRDIAPGFFDHFMGTQMTVYDRLRKSYDCTLDRLFEVVLRTGLEVKFNPIYHANVQTSLIEAIKRKCQSYFHHATPTDLEVAAVYAYPCGSFGESTSENKLRYADNFTIISQDRHIRQSVMLRRCLSDVLERKPWIIEYAQTVAV